ncbi:hypothetical protein KSP39_PZI010208 [Platanthera zijinensis]|uniref:Uncharacterized protein n=1 Tax=Platanthera zijinensis TaxID=2320716 RepID=A0AAP0BJL1_9ASPA
MFRNKILVTTRLASPSPSSFFLLHLSPSDSSSPIEIEILCWKLSRRFRLACFHPSPSSIFVIYQRSQTESAAQVVEEISKTLVIINVEDEEEVSSATLLATSMECWFRSLMLEKSWRCVGDCTFVESTFSRDKEKTHVQALNVVLYV